MDGLKAWGRGLAQLAIACAVALLVLAPSLDAVFCPGGRAVPADSSAVAAHVLKTVEIGENGKATAGLVGVCPWGHCHHGAPALPPIAAASAPIATAPTERHALLSATLPITHRHFELNRPPRA